MKKIYLEIIGIIVFSSLLGLIYNFFSTKPLSLIRKEQNIKVVNDSLLNVHVSDNQNNKDSTVKVDSIQNIQTLKQNNDKSKEFTDNKKINKDSAKRKEITKSQLVDGYQTLVYEQIIRHLKDPNFLFIDARQPENFAKARIGKAVNIFPYDEDKNHYFQSINQLPRDKILVVYCDGGNCDASHHVFDDLIRFGYTKVYLYQNGWDEWSKKRGIAN